MAITLDNTTTLESTGSINDGVISVPAGLVDDDVLILTIYASSEGYNVDRNHYLADLDSGTWTLELTRKTTWHEFRIYSRLVADAGSEPASYTISFSDATNRNRCLIATMTGLSGVDVVQPVLDSAYYHSNSGNWPHTNLEALHANDFVIHYANMFGYFGPYNYSGPFGADGSYTKHADVTTISNLVSSNSQVSRLGRVALGYRTVASAGPIGVKAGSSTTPAGETGLSGEHAVVILQPTGSYSGTPPVSGSGFGQLITEAKADRITIKSFEDDGASALVENELTADQAKLLQAELEFNMVGACVAGGVWITPKLDYTRFSQVFRLYLDYYDDEEPAVLQTDLALFAGLLDGIAGDEGIVIDEAINQVYRAELIGLDALRANDRVRGAETYPEHDIVPSARLLLNGATVTTGVGDVWQDILKRQLEAYPTAGWGVGRDLIWIQGRATDGTPVELSASDANVEAVRLVTSQNLDFVTDYALVNAGDTLGTEVSRDLPSILTPRRFEKSTTNEDSVEVPPIGNAAPMGSASDGYELTYRGIAIPPIKVTGLPDGGFQYATGVSVRILAGDSSGRPTTYASVIRTAPMPNSEVKDVRSQVRITNT